MIYESQARLAHRRAHAVLTAHRARLDGRCLGCLGRVPCLPARNAAYAIAAREWEWNAAPVR